MATRPRFLVLPALVALACAACAHMEALEPAAHGVALDAASAPRGCTPLGDVRGVEDEPLPHAERVASAVNAMRNEAARRGANRVDRVVVELSETPDGPPHAVAFGIAFRCDQAANPR